MTTFVGESKPFTVTLDQYREQGGPFGDVHLVLNIRFARKRETTLCGRRVESMRHQDPPFRGWAEVTCPDCAERMEL